MAFGRRDGGVLGSRFLSSVGHIGIDFGSGGVRLLQMRHRRGCWQVVDRARMEPEGEGVPTSEAFRHLLGEHRFVGRRCVVGVPRSETLIQSVRMPRLKDAEMKQAVLWEAAERFNRGRDELEVDYIRLGEVQRGAESRDEVLVIAAPRERLQQRLDSLIEAGLRPVAVELPVCAIVRTHSLRCRRDADQQHVRAILEIGGSGSSFMVLRGDQVAMCKPIEVGGADLDKAVAERLGLDLPLSRQLRQRRLLERARSIQSGHPAGEPDDKERAIFESVRALLDRLIREVGLCLRYHGVTFRGRPPERIVLAGADGLEPRLDAMLAASTKMPVAFEDPLSPVQPMLEGIGHSDEWGPAHGWLAAAGLSLRGWRAATVAAGSTSERRAAA